MEKIRIIIFTIILFIGEWWNYAAFGAETINPGDLYAKSALLMDGDSKRVLYEKNGYEKMPMASTTKILTCIVALENSNPDDVVKFSTYASAMPKVKLGAMPGEEFYMKDLLMSLMLESHNDTAVAIAESVAGSTEKFANMMNERAKSMGAFNSNFVTPNGLDDDNHYTTAYDLALITSEAIKNEEFVKIINTPSHSFSSINNNTSFSVSNKDAFLQMMDGAIGVKTGFTGKAGYCFVGAVKKNEKTFISVVLASGWPPSKQYKWKDTVKIMRYGCANYEYKNIFTGDKDYKSIPVRNGVKKEVEVMVTGKCDALVSDSDRIRYEYVVEEELEAPVNIGEKAGELIIYINDVEYCKLNIVTKTSSKEIDFKYSFMLILKKFII